MLVSNLDAPAIFSFLKTSPTSSGTSGCAKRRKLPFQSLRAGGESCCSAPADDARALRFREDFQFVSRLRTVMPLMWQVCDGGAKQSCGFPLSCGILPLFNP